MSEPVTGIVLIKVDGALLRSAPGAKLKVGGKVRKAVVAAGKVIGYAESVEPSTVSCELLNTADLDISEDGLGAITNASLEFDCDNGPVYMIAGAFVTNTPELTESDAGGKATLEFQGPPAKKIS